MLVRIGGRLLNKGRTDFWPHNCQWERDAEDGRTNRGTQFGCTPVSHGVLCQLAGSRYGERLNIAAEAVDRTDGDLCSSNLTSC